MTHIDRVIRKCRRCGVEWNVSCIDPGGKVYVCPTCEYRERLKEIQGNGR